MWHFILLVLSVYLLYYMFVAAIWLFLLPFRIAKWLMKQLF